jgi:LmbE family N-acetylglucosaminyl deacetylase
MHFLFAGAHSDDIEIGASGLLNRVVDDGHEVSVVVFTDDLAEPRRRREETVDAMQKLGVQRKHIMFGGAPDGTLQCNGHSVGQLRRLITGSASDNPAVVVAHSDADSHNDHRAVAAIVRGAFRHCAFLHYSIHISAEADRFQPRIYVELDDEATQRKNSALEAHVSQRSRIQKVSLPGYEAGLGQSAGLGRCEAFEVSYQEACPAELNYLLSLSDSRFHRLWTSLLGRDERLSVLYEGFERPGAPIDWPTQHSSAGRDVLRTAFARNWLPRSPLEELPSNTREAWNATRQGSVLLVGGAVTNTIVRDAYNRLEGLRWAVDYDIPRSRPAFLWDRLSNQKHYPFMRGAEVVRDFGYISRMANPFGPGTLLSTAACTGEGTQACLEFLARADQGPLTQGLVGTDTIEMPVVIDTRTKDIELWDSELVAP